MMLRNIFMLIVCSWIIAGFAKSTLHPAITHPIPIAELENYSNYSSEVKQLITKALSLTQKNLTYLYGSADPKNGGMDCSGTIYFLLQSATSKEIPRQSDEMFVWLEKAGKLKKAQHNFNVNEMKPGDLLFWSGTYNVKRNPPITHVMLYLGKNSKNQPLMFGASDGRTYQGKKMWGVSVFDFLLPKADSKNKFEGYGCIPDLTCPKN